MAPRWIARYDHYRPHDALGGLPLLSTPHRPRQTPLLTGSNYGVVTQRRVPAVPHAFVQRASEVIHSASKFDGHADSWYEVQQRPPSTPGHSRRRPEGRPVRG